MITVVGLPVVIALVNTFRVRLPCSKIKEFSRSFRIYDEFFGYTFSIRIIVDSEGCRDLRI